MELAITQNLITMPVSECFGLILSGFVLCLIFDTLSGLVHCLIEFILKKIKNKKESKANNV